MCASHVVAAIQAVALRVGEAYSGLHAMRLQLRDVRRSVPYWRHQADLWAHQVDLRATMGLGINGEESRPQLADFMKYDAKRDNKAVDDESGFIAWEVRSTAY